jgi:hypothetical protein
MKKRSLALTAASLCLALPLAAQSVFEDLAKSKHGRSMRSSSTFRKGPDGRRDPRGVPVGDNTEESNYDNCRSVLPGTAETVLEVQGSGAITHMWFTFLEPSPKRPGKDGAANHGEILLRIYWDGNPRPAVEAPFGDFFASPFGERRPVNSLPVVVEGGDAYNCYWYMPFRRSARIEVVNDGDRPLRLLYHNIDWIQKPIPADTPYFYARYRQEFPLTDGRDYVLLDTVGKGHYVGSVLAVRTRSPLWWGEGDEKIYINGEATPSIWGTGTEDFFNCAMGLESCSTPYFGVPLFDQFEIIGSKTGAYRWHIADPIVFETGIKVSLEHRSWTSEDENAEGKRMSWNWRQDDYASVAFWYQTGEPKFAPAVPKAAERKLPSLERSMAFGKDLFVSGRHGDGPAKIQEPPGLFEEPALLYAPGKAEGAWIEIPIEVKRKEPLRLLINAACSPDFGRYQPFLDGVKLGGPLDFFAEHPEAREFHLLDFWPDPGTYTLRLECAGKSVRSEGYSLGLESVRLRERRPRVEAIGRDRNNDWRKNPLFYTIW